MANVPESPAWEPGIYQLETTDPVLGGADGIDNLQAKQLANRTAYLKALVEDLEELISGISGGTTNHAVLSNRGDADAHPMSAITGLLAALAGKSDGAHVHNASAITAGILAEARLPNASSAARGIVQLVDDLQSLNTDRALTAAQGRALRLMIENMSGGGGATDHAALINRSAADSHPMSAISGLADALAGKASGSHVHSASQITSGVMDAARLPAGSTVVAGILRLANVLNSASQTEALTAAQGKVLKDLIDQIGAATLSYTSAGGYLRIPTASLPLYVQWIAGGARDGDYKAFPIAFPNACGVVVGADMTSLSTTYISVGAGSVTRNGFTVRATNLSPQPPVRWTHANFGAAYIAIGY